MVYEIRGSACEGYTVRFRYVTQSDTREASQITDQQTTTFEDADGKSFSFATKSYTDQNLDKELRGNATREPQGVKIQIDKPETKSFELRPTQFPTQHLVDLINRAKTGETFLRDQHLRRLRGRRQGDDHDRRRRQAGDASTSDPEAKALNSAEHRKILAGRHRLFRRNHGRRRGHAGIPHQLQALRERADARSRRWTMATSSSAASSSTSPCSSPTPSRPATAKAAAWRSTWMNRSGAGRGTNGAICWPTAKRSFTASPPRSASTGCSTRDRRKPPRRTTTSPAWSASGRCASAPSPAAARRSSRCSGG